VVDTQPANGPNRLKRGLFALIAAVAFPVILVSIVELFVPPPPPGESWADWRAQSHTYLLDDEVDWVLEPRAYEWGEISPDHFRGPAVDRETRSGALRIGVLGGSAAFDLWKADEATWPVLTARLLSCMLERPVDVVNAGTPGYSSWQSRRVLPRLLRYSPDVVLVYHLYNDSLGFRFEEVERIEEGWRINARANAIGWAARPGPLLSLSGALWPDLTDRFQRGALNRQRERGMSAVSAYWYREALDQTVSETGLHFYRDNLAAIASHLAERDVAVGFVGQASLLRSTMPPDQRALVDYHYRGLSHDRLWQAYLDAWGINRLVADAFENAFFVPAHERLPPRPELFLDEVHLTIEGGMLLASVIAEQLAPRFSTAPLRCRLDGVEAVRVGREDRVE